MNHPLLIPLQSELDALRQGRSRAAAFSQLARGQQALLDALPPRYAEVLHGLLDRLESGALFAEESCSFSQIDLFDSLQLWLDKAAQQLGPAATGAGPSAP